MRLGGKKSSGGTSKVGLARDVVSFLRGMTFDEIVRQVKDPPRLIFLSADPGAPELLEQLTGVTASPATEIVDPSRIPQRLTDYDLILVHEPTSNEAFIQAR
jgi:hypothetical protein